MTRRSRSLGTARNTTTSTTYTWTSFETTSHRLTSSWNPQSDRVVKIVGVRGDYDSKYHFEEIDEFLYEGFWKDYRNNWRVDKYNWLHDQATADYNSEEERNKYKKWCLTPYTEINNHSESMYMVGKDGLLYVDYGCDRDYRPFRRITNEQFDQIRAEAVKNAETEDL